MIDLKYINPYNKPTEYNEDIMIASKNRIKQLTKNKKTNKKQLEQIRLQAKVNAPGVPPNTCPYIDLTITCVQDLVDCYDRLKEKNEYSPVHEEIAQRATDTLEYIRKCNETLRDNSGYWYNKYKQLLINKK